MSRPSGYAARNVSDGSSPNLAGGAQGGRNISAPVLGPGVRANSNVSRAERFEDEKHRIVESCFSKLDPNGQLAESYITHVRITEDAQYPSTPPPPESAPDNKKPRVVIIAVRSTGRVRMHKARENTNGSFSIGKTWNLEELSAIESFAHCPHPPTTEREAQHRQWAGSAGFVVTITKPYFWQAGSSKEKDFFIASAVKIYRKYTRGQVPEMRGFDDTERAQILGVPAPANQASQAPQTHQAPPPPLAASVGQQNGRRSPSPAPPHPPFAQRDQSRDGSRYRGSPGPPPSVSDQPVGPARKNSDSPARFNGLPAPAGPRPFASQEQMRSQSPAQRADLRPGTSPAPGPALSQTRSPPPIPGSFPAPSQKSSQSQLRTESPSNATPSNVGITGPQTRRPSRPQSPPEPVTGRVEGRNETSLNSRFQDVSGPTLFQNTRQRWAQAQPHNNDLNGTEDSSIAEIEQRLRTPVESSANGTVPLGGVTTSEHERGGAPSSPLPGQFFASEPRSPATPERSRRRPTFDPYETEDLRPEPLLAASRPSSSKSQNRSEMSTSDASRVDPTAEVKPLALAQNRPSLPQNDSETSHNVALDATRQSEASNEAILGTESELATSPDEQFRPGLGPMMKKGNARDRFRKAAAAATAFKPRPGGAAEKIMRAKAEREAGILPEPDGITSVVPRPQALQPKQNSSEDHALESQEDSNKIIPPGPATPEIDIQSPTSPAKYAASPISTPAGVKLREIVSTGNPPEEKRLSADLRLPVSEENDDVQGPDILEQPTKARIRSQFQNQCLDELGIDRSLLEGKGLDFEAMLEEFGWKDEALHPSQLSRLEHDIRREQGRLEAGSWLSAGADVARDEKVSQVEALLDKTLAECEELEGLLTLYSVELGSLNDDITYIEAQSQGLQVQSANQQLLQSELQGLLQTMSLDKHALDPLRYANLEESQQLEEVEQSLVKLYQAMVTIDPSIRSSDRDRRRRRSAFAGGEDEGSELATMRAVREKKEVYHRESSGFCQRLMQHLDYTFTTSFNNAKKSAIRPASSSSGPAGAAQRINKDAFADARQPLWVYSPLLLFSKEVDLPAWNTILRMYYSRAQPLYADAFAQNITGWKKLARKPIAEEAELLFTTALKNETAAPGTSHTAMGLSAARRLTVKRSQTLAKTLRHAGGGGTDKVAPVVRQPQGANLMSSEVFAGVLDEVAPLVSQEQNFIVDLFHATSLDAVDFLDTIRKFPLETRRGTNLLDRKPVEPDRDMAKRVHGLMTELFESNFGSETQKLVEWSISLDPLQGVGVMACLSKHAYYLQDTSQEFLLQLVESVSMKLQSRWNKFVEEQVRAIEDTKVKIKKRKGVIGFMKVFPHFSAAVENIFSAIAGLDYDGPAECVMAVRRSVDDAYSRINRAMFDSLKVIAKESPGAGTQTAQQQVKSGLIGGAEDPEDKEMLNYHVLLIENMNHYIEGVDDGGKEGVLAEWRGRAMLERAEALEAYVSRVLKRPLGKLIDFLDSVDSLLSTSASPNPQAIAARPSYSRKAARNLLAQYDSKEARRGIETLRRRVEKHFGDGDEEAYSRQLVGVVFKECERGYERVIDRTENIIREVYPPLDAEKPVSMEFSRADVQAGFSR